MDAVKLSNQIVSLERRIEHLKGMIELERKIYTRQRKRPVGANRGWRNCDYTGRSLDKFIDEKESAEKRLEELKASLLALT